MKHDKGDGESDTDSSSAKEWEGCADWEDRRARGDLKNNKTKAIEKKYKKRLITKSQNSKGGKGDKFSKGGKGSFNKKRWLLYYWYIAL